MPFQIFPTQWHRLGQQGGRGWQTYRPTEVETKRVRYSRRALEAFLYPFRPINGLKVRCYWSILYRNIGLKVPNNGVLLFFRVDYLLNGFAFFVIMLMVMGLGAFNEIVEFLVVLTVKNTGVGQYYNNLSDMVANFIGTLLTTVLLYISFRKSQQPKKPTSNS
jgi:hypothetical protein